jgi:hypothetical protein
VLVLGLLAAAVVRAGPEEAARLWEAARALAGAPAAARREAYRQVVEAAGPWDPLRRRARLAVARLLEDVGHWHAAAGWQAAAASDGPRAEPDNLRALVRLARTLTREGDARAAMPLLEEVQAEAPRSVVTIAHDALEVLADEARLDADPERLGWVARRLAELEAPLDQRLEVAADLGGLWLLRGEREGAAKARAAAEALYDQALRESRLEGPEDERRRRDALRAIRRWLDHPLRTADLAGD